MVTVHQEVFHISSLAALDCLLRPAGAIIATTSKWPTTAEIRSSHFSRCPCDAIASTTRGHLGPFRSWSSLRNAKQAYTFCKYPDPSSLLAKLSWLKFTCKTQVWNLMCSERNGQNPFKGTRNIRSTHQGPAIRTSHGSVVAFRSPTASQLDAVSSWSSARGVQDD